MQFPFYTESGIQICKNSIKLGLKSNIPVWIYCDVNLNSFNGSLSFNESNIKMFFSLKDLKDFVSSGVDNYEFWRNVILIVTLFVGSVTAYKMYNKNRNVQIVR